jgi:hypothetical protein
MQSFIQRHASCVMGVLNGFDRVRLRGTLRWLANRDGMLSYLYAAKVLLKDFKDYAVAVTERIRAASHQIAEEAGRPLMYLNSTAISKEEIARKIAQRDRVQEGLICVLTCTEPCFSYRVGRNRQKRELELRGERLKCLHHYFYFQHPQLGFLHVRLQTWFPLTLHVCLNGREWLARQMDIAGLGYVQRDNCFVQLADIEAAQALCNDQLRIHWAGCMNRLMEQVHPTHRELFRELPTSYYWSIEESEWASDVMFRSPQALAKLYPSLIRHGMTTLGSPDVMRFLGRKLPKHGGVHGRFSGEVVSDLKARPEGLRIKHRLNFNSIKMYDKQGSVLRVETTINDARDLKVYRRKEGDSQGKKKWLRMRKSVADVARRAHVSQAANERYLKALAAVEPGQPLGELTSSLCQPVIWQGRRARALNPFSGDDAQLLAAVSRGEFALNGFRNRDLRVLLYGHGPVAPEVVRRESAAITRRLRLLRAHGLITKVTKTHRYTLTDKGRLAITALLAAKQADAAKLNQLAA